MTNEHLQAILSKPGYGIVSTIGKSSIKSQIVGSREIDNLESDSGDESLRSEKLQINYSGKVRVRITFYRRRLADYGEGCSRAVSEKAIIDCLVYAGLIEGDSGEEIWLEDGGQKKVKTDEEERTELEIFYPEVDLDNLWIKAKENKAR
jgi:hypothetical protein